jgi:hypothetical protein
MPWRVIAYGNVLSFRGTSGKVRDRYALPPFPLEASSRSASFLQAEQIPGMALAHLLARRVA